MDARKHSRCLEHIGYLEALVEFHRNASLTAQEAAAREHGRAERLAAQLDELRRISQERETRLSWAREALQEEIEQDRGMIRTSAEEILAVPRVVPAPVVGQVAVEEEEEDPVEDLEEEVGDNSMVANP
ncbi:hypothetical protein OROGR_015062 [Orobanche gracilis]